MEPVGAVLCVLFAWLLANAVLAFVAASLARERGLSVYDAVAVTLLMGPVGLLMTGLRLRTPRAQAEHELAVEAERRAIAEEQSPEAAARRRDEERRHAAWQEECAQVTRAAEERARAERERERAAAEKARAAEREAARQREIDRLAAKRAAREAAAEAKHKARWVDVACPKCGEAIRVRANQPSVCWNCKAELAAVEP